MNASISLNAINRDDVGVVQAAAALASRRKRSRLGIAKAAHLQHFECDVSAQRFLNGLASNHSPSPPRPISRIIVYSPNFCGGGQCAGISTAATLGVGRSI